MTGPVRYACAICDSPLASPDPQTLAIHRATHGACVPSPALRAATLDAALPAALARIESGADAAQSADLECDCLGTIHRYPLAPQLRANYLGARAEVCDWDAQDPAGAPYTLGLTCTDGGGLEAQRPHTCAQLRQLCMEGALHIEALAARRLTLAAQARALAATAADPADPAAAAEALAALATLDWSWPS